MDIGQYRVRSIKPRPIVSFRHQRRRASPVSFNAKKKKKRAPRFRRFHRFTRRHHHLPAPLTHPISPLLYHLPSATSNHLRRGAPRLGLIGNGPIFGISAHSSRDLPLQLLPPPRSLFEAKVSRVDEVVVAGKSRILSGETGHTSRVVFGDKKISRRKRRWHCELFTTGG